MLDIEQLCAFLSEASLCIANGEPDKAQEMLKESILLARAALAAQPEPAAQDIEDAERYRWLISNCGFGIRKNGVIELSVSFNTNSPDNIGDVESSIDAARAATKTQGGA